MSTGMLLPREWESLPQWAKEELLYGAHDLSCYSRHIQRLVDHGENMKAVWRLFETHRDAFTSRWPLHSLLLMLDQADNGLDPGLRRSDDDRQAIAKDIQKHAAELLTQVSRLGSGAWLGQYPIGIGNVVDLAAWEDAQRRVAEPFKEVADGITDALDDAAIAPDVRELILGHIEWLQYEMEREFMGLHSDPRASLTALAEGAKEWAMTCGWDRNDAIWYIGSTLKDWFGGNQFSAAATLATAVLGQEISEDTAASVIKRKLKSQPYRKVKVKGKDSSHESDRHL